MAPPAEPSPAPSASTPSSDELVAVSLGELVHARSGDKGGDANLGVWVRDRAAWDWLTSTLTVDELRRLLPETRQLAISRYELPNLGAVNFVLRGLLGTGATSTLRLDAQAKALGEWLRSRTIEAPQRSRRGRNWSERVTWAPRTSGRRTTLSRTRLAPRLESFVRTSTYAELSAILVKARATVAATLDGVTARVLHTVNLPAGTDLKRLRRQVGDLDRAVRQPAPRTGRLRRTPRGGGRTELWRYRNDDVRYRPPLLIVFRLVTPSYVLDLTPGKCFVERLVAAGFDVHLLDWAPPTSATPQPRVDAVGIVDAPTSGH